MSTESVVTPQRGFPDGDAIQTFHERVHGPVLQPGDREYTEARSVFNAKVEKYPSFVVRCTGPADVIAAVEFARDHDLLLSVKSGGHNVAGTAVCNDGLVVDLSELDGIRVDPTAQRARVGPGATWKDFDHETGAFGLATPGAMVSTVGVAGLTLGGGQGFLARKHGLTIDNLIGADVVTASGELVHASETEHPDLFWGLRGGGGNFGVATSLEFDVHPISPEVVGGVVVHPLDSASEALTFYRDWLADAPEELACHVLLTRVPGTKQYSRECRGKPAVVFAVCYAGPPGDAEPALEPLRRFGAALYDDIEPREYATLQSRFDDLAPAGYRWDSKTHYLTELTEGAIETIVEQTAGLPGQRTQVLLEPMGGQVSRVDTDATAYPHREVSYSLSIWAGWVDPERDGECIEWTQTFHEAMAPYATGGAYANYLSDESESVGAAYGENYDRLVEVKNEWDPTNLFRMNQNVEPTVARTNERT